MLSKEYYFIIYKCQLRNKILFLSHKYFTFHSLSTFSAALLFLSTRKPALLGSEKKYSCVKAGRRLLDIG